ncbi:two pore channel protein 2-like [Mercenaria mercenaria]|uniref:two pore channel protein 2-like n=1 Tax=Mercenaria mercenaria TaxID=6596 RepID=UPI00234F3529|nr:two pore channel protein 2-like [Mercenaria mercenaria]
MDSGIETSPIPSFEPSKQAELKPEDKSSGDKLKSDDSEDPVRISVYDSNSEADENDDKEFLIPDPVPNRGFANEGAVPVSQYGSIQAGHTRVSSSTTGSSYDNNENLCLLQAQVFLEDAAMYRSIDHKVDFKSLKVYQFYHSKPFSLLRSFVILVLHMLAFFEFPSSLTWTSDIRTRDERVEFPCGVTETLELFCLVFLIADIFMKSRIYGNRYLLTNRWLLVAEFILVVSLTDWIVSLSMGCKEVVRVRRMLRPVFIIQNSSLMKKILNCLRKTLSQILGVLLLMALHLYIFTLFGMLLFPKQGSTDASVIDDGLDIEGSPGSQSGNGTQGHSESEYFRTLTDSFMSLLVLLTTADNPDVTLPAYNRNRLYAVFFIVFLIIGLYCFMNMLTAIIYNQFRGYFLNSMQSSLMRRRLGQRAAFEALKNKTVPMNQSSIEINELFDVLNDGVNVRDLKLVVSRAKISEEMKVILVDVSGHISSLTWFFLLFELATQYDKSLNSSQSTLRIINFLFIIYYVVEQSLIILCMGWRRYRYSWANLYDGAIVVILLLSELITVAMYGFPFFSQKETHGNFTLWNIVRVINILIMFRLLRVIWHIKTMAIVAHTLLDLVKNLKSFGGILIVIYYFFAILGMELFQDKITFPTDKGNASQSVCGTYEQLNYWANNFDDFAAAIVVLWDVMVVNNWFVFLDAYAKYTTKWSYLYFIVWWLTSVVIVLNLFTALILENFIMKWDKFHTPAQPVQRRRTWSNSLSINTLTVHDIFKSNLKEPTEEDILQNMSKLNYFNVQT